MPLSAGDRLGPYEILSSIGAGGMGDVYKARDTRLDRIVAVKVSKEQFSQRFEREARAVAALNHPNICTIHDVGPNYLVMEYLEGETLEARIAKGPLPLDQALTHAIHIAEALSSAHRRSVVHRDLKPANVMLTKSGVKLLDFGLARLGPDPEQAVPGDTVTIAMTTPGTILGTFQYMSPEQLEAKEADARSDIFAFGAVLYEMLTGRRAFECKSQASLISAIMTAEPAPVSSIQSTTPVALDRVVKKCLAKDPDKRWQSASDLADELKWVGSRPSQPDAPARTDTARTSPSRLPWAVATLAIASALVVGLFYLRRPPVEDVTTKVSVLPPAGSALRTDSAPVISPDGRRVAFVARDSSGKTLLWVRPLDSLTAQPLLGTEEAREPFWSPDSRSLGFFAPGQLKRIDIAGGPAQAVCPISTVYSFGGTWGADNVILFSPNSVTALQSVSAAGGQPKAATEIDKARQDRGHVFPHFLPDGRHFVYVAISNKRENSGIFLGSVDSKDTKLLFSGQAEVRYSPPGYLLFVREGSLVAQPFDASRRQLSGEAFPVANQVDSDPIFGDGMFSVSENGVLAYRAGAGSGITQLMWFGRDGKPQGPAGPPGEYVNPNLSPDGKRVVFERRSAQGGRDLWQLEFSKGIPQKFTFADSDEYAGTYSPDGSQIVFSSNRNGAGNLFQKPSNGAGEEQPLLKATTDLLATSWSSDGRTLFYRSMNEKGENEIWYLPMGDQARSKGEATKPVAFFQSDTVGHNMPMVSPNGRWVAYYSNESGAMEVYIQGFPKPAGQWQVSTNGGIFQRWTRGGAELIYMQPDQKMIAVSVSGDSAPEFGTRTPLFESPAVGGARTVQTYRHQWDVTSDGQRFLINTPVAEDASTPITLVLNWTAGLKK